MKIPAYKNIPGEIFHLSCGKLKVEQTEKGTESFPVEALCGHEIASASVLRLFEDIKNPNICRHCALELQRRVAKCEARSAK